MVTLLLGFKRPFRMLNLGLSEVRIVNMLDERVFDGVIGGN